MSRVFSVIAAMALVASPIATAQASGLIPLSGGITGYQFDYTVSATFGCHTGWYSVPGDCSANGNSITLTHDGASLTMTFTPSDGIATAASGGPIQPFEMGTLTQTLSGVGTFSLPGWTAEPIFGLRIQLTSTDPVAWSGAFSMLGWQDGPNLMTIGQSVEYGTAGPLLEPMLPTPQRYILLLQTAGPNAGSWVIGTGVASTQFDAQASLAPEPGTFVLVAPVLAVIAGVGGPMARRRDRRRALGPGASRTRRDGEEAPCRSAA